MKRYYLKDLLPKELKALYTRCASNSATIRVLVDDIISDIRIRGDAALRMHCAKHDAAVVDDFLVYPEEINYALNNATPQAVAAMRTAITNIQAFHAGTSLCEYSIETMPGVHCSVKVTPIESVGIYVPGGTAPLPSTLLMLAVPATIAGCKNIIVATPPNSDGNVDESVLLAASFFDNISIYKIGGAQAIAAMAYGTESIPKIDKIFGPGNQYVTMAKMLVSQDANGAAFDAPAGPSEVLIIADNYANVQFVAADLLAQAEHSTDAQVVLICLCTEYANAVQTALYEQARSLSRRKIIATALNNSFTLIVENLQQALAFSNSYAPEHLIVNTCNAADLAAGVTNAGSVFVGAYSCEAAGDYASGPNHTLPTAGAARCYSGITTASFQKQIFFQIVSQQGALLLQTSVGALANLEGLDAHGYSMALRR